MLWEGSFSFLAMPPQHKKSTQTGTALARSRENCMLYTSQFIQGSHSNGLMITALIGDGYVKRLNFSAAGSSSRKECGGRMGGEKSVCPRASVHRRVGWRRPCAHKKPLSQSQNFPLSVQSFVFSISTQTSESKISGWLSPMEDKKV